MSTMDAFLIRMLIVHVINIKTTIAIAASAIA